MTAVRVPTPLRPYTGGERELQVEADTVAVALQNLTRDYPQLRQHVFDDSDSLRSYVNIFVNDDDVRNLHGLQTKVGHGDRITIVPSIAGGAGVRR